MSFARLINSFVSQHSLSYLPRLNLNEKKPSSTLARTTGGLIISYFQVDWTRRTGAKTALATQAAIAAFGFLIIPLLQLKGKSLRRWAGPIQFQQAGQHIQTTLVEAAVESKEKIGMITIAPEDDSSLLN